MSTYFIILHFDIHCVYVQMDSHNHPDRSAHSDHAERITPPEPVAPQTNTWDLFNVGWPSTHFLDPIPENQPLEEQEKPKEPVNLEP